MMNEHCWILLGGWREDLWWGKRTKPTEGAPCSVRFNPKYVTEREEKYHDVVGFIHTHPGMSAHYSGIDDATMKAWVFSLGKPLVCCIIGTDGLRAWWYLNDEDPPVEYQAKSLRGIVFGMTPEEFFDEEEEEITAEEEIEFLEAMLPESTVEGVESRTNAAESEVEPAGESCPGAAQG
jgi:proteasome lid subunit RPN8/RPN11